MLSGVGIGQEIERKKEAYRGNPQALQKRYQQNKQLIDLLALQQLKSEKETAVRNMQAQMQQNPATIAQQREQELLAMIKQEQGQKLGDVAKRTAGTLGQINKRAQQNMQRTAKRGLPSMAGLQGMGGLQGMRGPQRRMAEGGIIGFQEGSVVADVEIDEFLTRFNLPNSPRNRELATREIIELRAKEAKSAARTQALAGKAPGTESRRAQRQFEKEYDPAISADEGVFRATPEELAMFDDVMRPGSDRPQEGLPAVTTETKDGENVKNTGLDNLFKDLKSPTVVQPKFGTERQEAVQSIIEKSGVGNVEARRREREAAEKRSRGMLEEAAGIRRSDDGDLIFDPKQDQLDRLTALQRQQSDPDKLRRQRLTAGLLGAAGRGSTALAGFGAGMFNERVRQEAKAEKDLAAQFGIENERTKLNFDIANATITSGQDAVNVLSKDQQAKLAAFSSAAGKDADAAIALANQAFQADLQGVKTKVELMKQRLEDARARAEQADDKELAYAELAKEFLLRQDEIRKIIADAIIDRAPLGSLQDAESATNYLNDSNLIDVILTEILENADLNNFQTEIMKKAGGGANPPNPQRNTLNVESPELLNAIERFE
jgi:hypothetical protein